MDLTLQHETSLIPLTDPKPELAAIIPVKFEVKYKTRTVPLDPDDPKSATKQVTEREEWVTWAKKGVTIPSTNSDAVKRVKRDPQMWPVIEPYYENWKKGGEGYVVPPGQTALDCWSGIGKDLAEHLRQYRIYSVEDMATMSDDVASRIPDPVVFKMRETAKKWLATKDTVDLAREAAEKGAAVQAMSKRIEELERLAADLMAKEKAAEERAKPKAKPKRMTDAL